MSSRRTWVAVVCALLMILSVIGAGAGVVGGEEDRLFIRGEPDLDVFLPDQKFTPGTADELVVQIANDGEVTWGATTQPEIVTSARNVRVAVDDDAPFSVETGEQAIGTVGTDVPGEAAFAIRVADDAEPGEYEVDVDLEYSHTRMYSARAGVLQERTRTVTRTVDVIIDDRPRFDIRGIDTELQVGDRGTVTAEVHNVGAQPATDIDVAVESTSPHVRLGEGAAVDSARIDRLEPDETATVTYDADMLSDATARNYSLVAQVQFTDENGIRDADRNRTFAFFPTPEQEFDLELDESTLRVGEIGTVTGTVRNVGPQPVETVALELADGPFEAIRHTHAIGALDVGEAADFRLRVAVPADAEPVPHRIDINTTYRSAQDYDRVVREPLIAPVGEQDFAIDIVDSSLRVGERGSIRGTIENTGPVDATAVTLVLGESRFEPRSESYSIGDLSVNETASFEFRGTIPESTDPVPRRIDVTTEYRTPADVVRATNDSVHVPVAERRDAVAVEAVDARFTAGEDRTLELEATNQRDVELRDIRFNLSVADPLESDFRTTMLESLEPGESGTIGFDLEVDRDAPLTQYPAVVGIEYTDPDDDRIVDRPATVAVTVVETPWEFFVAIEIIVFIVLLVLVGALFVWLYRR